MARIHWLTWAIALLLVTHTAGQTSSSDDLLGGLISDAYGVYTEVTSAIGSVAAAASAAAASSSDAAASSSDASAASTTSSTPSSTQTSSTSDRSSPSPSPSSTGTSPASSDATAVAAASAADSSSTSSPQKGGGGNSNLPIILGCVLGALALGLFVLVLLLCCRRRRHRSRDSEKSRALSPDDHEVDSWKRPAGHYGSRHGPNKEMGYSGVPLMAEHPAFRNHQEHENPFVPVPPAPRRSTPNSRAGLTDGTVAGTPPYLMDKETGRPLPRKSEDSSHKGRNLAMGAGAVGLGAAALHHHNKSSDGQYDNDRRDSGRGTTRDLSRDRYHSLEQDPNHHNGRDLAMGAGAAGVGGAAMQHHNGMDKGHHPGLSNDEHLGVVGSGNPNINESGNPHLSREGETGMIGEGHHNLSRESSSHNVRNMALGAGAVGLGGAALHHHHNNSKDSLRDMDNDRHHRMSRDPYSDIGPDGQHHMSHDLGREQHAGVLGDQNNQMSPAERHSLGRENSSHTGRNLALGAGAAGLGGAALHHHNKSRDDERDMNRDYQPAMSRDEGIEVNNPYTRSVDPPVSRKPLPMNDKFPIVLQGNPATSANNNSVALSKSERRRSMDSARSRPSRDAARANAVFDDQYEPMPDHANTERDALIGGPEYRDHPAATEPKHVNHSGPQIATALGAGALGGAALAHHHGRSRSRSASRSRSPHRRSLQAAKKNVSDSSNTNSDTSASSNSNQYSDAVDHQHKMSGGMPVTAPTDIPPTPRTRSRHDSPLGRAAPAAAALSYISPGDRDRSTSRPHSYPHSPDDYSRFQNQEPALPDVPMIPNRSPRRSFSRERDPMPNMPLRGSPRGEQSYFPDQTQASEYNHGPLSNSVHTAMSPHAYPEQSVYSPPSHPLSREYTRSPEEPYEVSTPGVHPLHTSTGIVGDSRYPHHNVPRRRSGGEYDYAHDSHFMPAAVPLPPGAARDSRSNSISSQSRQPMPAEAPPVPGSNETSSDEGTWRSSHGMPGGWQRARSGSPRAGRKSYDAAASERLRDSSIGNGGGRLRLADLRRQEEEMLQRKGRQSMGSEWMGNGGYDGYGSHNAGGQRFYQNHDGVGVAR